MSAPKLECMTDRHDVHDAAEEQFSSAGRVMTRNPVKLVADGRSLTLWAAPDNGEDGAGTQLYTWTTTVAARR